MAEASIPVDFLNPGQVFACLGFLEAAELLCGSAEGAFDWHHEPGTRFRLAATGKKNPFAQVLEFLAQAEVVPLAPPGSQHNTQKSDIETVSLSSHRFPFPDPPKPATLPARLQDACGRSFTIDHWGDTTRRDNVKFWGANCRGSTLARKALQLMRDHVLDHVNDPFALAAEQTSSFRFDWRRDYVPIDVGFSPNKHKKDIVMQGYPVVELLAAIGLTHARPSRDDRLNYRYGVVGADGGSLYDPIFLRLALGATKRPIPGLLFRLFSMQLGSPGQEGKERCITNVVEETYADD